MNEPAFKPKGFEFLDKNQRPMLFVQEGEWTGWLAYKHTDGQWVSLRLATKEDLETVQSRIAIGN